MRGRNLFDTFSAEFRDPDFAAVEVFSVATVTRLPGARPSPFSDLAP